MVTIFGDNVKSVVWTLKSNTDKISDHKTHDLNTDEIIVPVQQMFPNCRKYDPCCKEAGTAEMMEKFQKMVDKPIERIRKKAEKDHRINIIWRSNKPVKKNPFPDDDVLG